VVRLMDRMNEAYEAYCKKYPEKERKALWEARKWIADKDYLYGHIRRVKMESEVYGIEIVPTGLMYDFIRDAIRGQRMVHSDEESVECAFRMQAISLEIGSLVVNEQTDERILEWLDWCDVAEWFGCGARPPLLMNSLHDRAASELWRRVKEIDEGRPHCPECNSTLLDTKQNEQGQVVYKCQNGWRCGTFTSDVDN
jgi:hypothetical protein